MSPLRASILPLVGLLAVLMAGCASGRRVVVPGAIDHTPYTVLLQDFVDDRGLVDYQRWRADEEARRRLADYLATFANADAPVASGAERHAALINLYNALTISEVLRLAPADSFWSHGPFGKRIHTVYGVAVSLDDIEHGSLRPEVGYRAHAALVCAAVSCPPLAREAYTTDRLEAQLDERMRVWLARDDLNRFVPAEDTIYLSKIFSWFRADFAAAPGGLAGVLQRHGPAAHRDFIAEGDWEVRYLAYDKSLNRQPTSE